MVDISITINSNDIRCPITGEILLEPVVASDGHIYERQALDSWLSTNTTSPMTREQIIKHDYNVNIFYKNIIQKMLMEYPELKDEQYEKNFNHEYNQFIINKSINNYKFNELLKYKNFKLELFNNIDYLLRNCNVIVLKHIIDNIIDSESCSSHGWKFIHYVSYYSTSEMIKYVINKGVDLNNRIKKFNGVKKNYNIVDLINLNEKLTIHETEELVDLLKEKECKFIMDNMTHELNQGIIDKIMNTSDYVKLQKYKDFNFALFDRNKLINFLKNPENLNTIKYVIDNTLNIQETDSNGYYPMHVICKSSFPEVIKYAINKGWILEISCKTGYKPLHFILRYQKPELIKQVLDMDIDLDLPGGDGWRPIHYLCRYSTIEMVEYLLDKGVDLKSDIIQLNGELNERTSWKSMISQNINLDDDSEELLLGLINSKLDKKIGNNK